VHAKTYVKCPLILSNFNQKCVNKFLYNLPITRPRKVLKWVPQQKHKQGQPRKSRRNNTEKAMEARDLTEKECYSKREEYRLGVRNGDSCK
jgi:hypothetical protein